MNSKPQTFGLSVEDLAQYQAVFANYPQIEKVILYGSRAKGTYRASSDIDLTIVGDLDWSTFTRLESELDDLLLPYQVDLSLYSQIDNPDLIEHIQRVGKPFFKR
ncbi:hypothetical protein THMIRHAS_05050 [Thiosulfatimonas sediminis]|uniref:Polymerase beta nucleotidyltransferase domain-containing protein n=1 Tax=Thiosulfatimonas sediminis TaxID=2675054 RepID=A0A6F8PSM0_9GAMM|nr:nucleotidyltransferase domain-containing protein [Thiosulfatimonas sediminis]BBP45132.1 hypothetical protein THMIRHAS_05050 [Thiosulfatimonas sediminis]